MRSGKNCFISKSVPERALILFTRSSSLLEIFAAVMQEPFPALADLYLLTLKTTPALLEEFLGGSAPRLLWHCSSGNMEYILFDLTSPCRRSPQAMAAYSTAQAQGRQLSNREVSSRHR